MKVLTKNEVEQVSAGDGIVTTGGIIAGVAAGALVIGTGGGILVGAALGAAIWNAGWAILQK